MWVWVTKTTIYKLLMKMRLNICTGSNGGKKEWISMI